MDRVVSPVVWETGFQSQVVIHKTQKMVLGASLLNFQHYKDEGLVKQSSEMSSPLSYTSV